MPKKKPSGPETNEHPILKRVSIKNFRSIEDCELSPSRLCAIVGENNAGKTNILRAIKTVLEKDWHRVTDFEEEDFIDGSITKDIEIELEFDPPLKHQEYKNWEAVAIPILHFKLTRYKVTAGKGNKGDLRLEAKPLTAEHTPIMIPSSAPKRGERPAFAPLTSIPASLKSQVPVIYVAADRRLDSQLPSARYSMLRRLLETVDTRVKEEKATDGDGEQSISDVFLQRLDTALQVLRVPEFVELEALLRKHALENLGLEPNVDPERFNLSFGISDSFAIFKTIRLIITDNSHKIDAMQLGDGAQNALVVAIFQAYEKLRRKGAIFLIEEPEMYLHPHRSRLFYDTLQRISKENQVIYTTHSSHFVTIPDFQNVRLVSRDQMRRTKVRRSSLAPDPQLLEKLRKEFDPERNELFFAKHVVLVEGDTEKLALPEYAKRLEVQLNQKGVSVIEVGGKRSLKAFCEVVSSFGIPLTLMFDSDSSDFDGQREAEATYNDMLRALAAPDVRIIEVAPKYEKALEVANGAAKYQQLCETHGGVSKAIRGRRIAADPESVIPEVIRTVLLKFKPGEKRTAQSE